MPPAVAGLQSESSPDCPAEIPVPIKKPQNDPGRIDPGIDVERTENAVRTADILTPLFLDPEPGFPPVPGILRVPLDYGPDGPGIEALRRDHPERLLDEAVDIVLDKGQRIHGRHVKPAVVSVPVVHDVAHAVADPGRRIDHAGAHQTCEIGLDLEIDVVGMGVVQPVAGLRRSDAVEDVIAGHLVGVPEHVAGLGELLSESPGRRIQPFLLDNLNKGQVHVDVVVKTGHVFEEPRQRIRSPVQRLIVGDKSALKTKLGRTAVGAADGLPGPASLDLVQQAVSRKSDKILRTGVLSRDPDPG
jgi:hypothetical protein